MKVKDEFKDQFLTIPTGKWAGQIGKVEEVREKVAILRVNNLRVEIDRSIFDAVTAEEDKEGKPTKRIRPTKNQDEGEGDEGDGKPGNRKQKSRARQTPQIPPPPTLTPVNQNTEKREEKKKVNKEAQVQIQTKTQTQQTQFTPSPAAPARVEPLYCPVCPGDQPKTRRRPTDLVCGDCYRRYTNEAAIALAKGKVVNIFDWVVGKAPAILAALEEQFATAKAEIEALQGAVREEVYQNLKRTTGGRQVPREVWNQAFRTQQGNLWRNKGGNVKFARMKGLEGRIALLKSILEKANEPKPAVEPPAVPATVEQPTPAAVEPPPAAEETPPPPVKKPRKPRQPRASKKAEAKKE